MANVEKTSDNTVEVSTTCSRRSQQPKILKEVRYNLPKKGSNRLLIKKSKLKNCLTMLTMIEEKVSIDA